MSSSETTGNESNVSAFSNIYTLIDALVKDSRNLGINDYWDDTQSRRTAVSISIFSNTTKSLCIFHDDESVTIAARARNIKPRFIAIRKRSPTASVDRHCKERHCGHRGSPRAAFYNHPLREVQPSPARSDFGQRVIPAGMSGWEEFERQASGDIDEMVDEGVATARLSEHILSPTPKRQEKVII